MPRGMLFFLCFFFVGQHSVNAITNAHMGNSAR